MSATEIIEQIQALAPDEQRQVYIFVLQHLGSMHSGKDAALEPIGSIAARIFDRYDPLFRKLAE